MTRSFHQARFAGVFPPVLTPRTDAGEFDVASFHRLLQHLLDGGAHGVFVLGSSGEVPYLTSPERDLVLRETMDVVDGRVPVMVGLSEQTPHRVIDEGARLLRIGGDAAVVTGPFYAQPDDAEIETHFRQIAAHVDVPVIAYDIPSRTHYKIPRSVIVRLARDGVLAGVKDSSGDDISLRQLALDTADLDGFSVSTGHEVVVDGAMLSGATGIVPGLGNVDPAGYVRLYKAAREGRWEDAAREQDRLARLFRVVEAADPARVSPGANGLGGFKTALTLLGVLASNRMAEPMLSLNEHETDRVRQILSDTGLL